MAEQIQIGLLRWT